VTASPQFGPAARVFMRAGMKVMLVRERLRGGPPEGATCADVQRSRRKLREVARAIYEELRAMEESHARIHGTREGVTPVAERFRAGWRDIEPLVLEACAGSAPDDRPYAILLPPLARELGV
jgi:hypothetical protein